MLGLDHFLQLPWLHLLLQRIFCHPLLLVSIRCIPSPLQVGLDIGVDTLDRVEEGNLVVAIFLRWKALFIATHIFLVDVVELELHVEVGSSLVVVRLVAFALFVVNRALPEPFLSLPSVDLLVRHLLTILS